MNSLKKLKMKENIDSMVRMSQKVGPYNLIRASFDDIDQGGLREIYDVLKSKQKRSIITLFSRIDNKLSILIALSKDLANASISAEAIVKELNKTIEGQGGGKKQMAFSGSNYVEMLEEAMNLVPKIVERQCNDSNI